jgi:hypothetical protein
MSDQDPTTQSQQQDAAGFPTPETPPSLHDLLEDVVAAALPVAAALGSLEGKLWSDVAEDMGFIAAHNEFVDAMTEYLAFVDDITPEHEEGQDDRGEADSAGGHAGGAKPAADVHGGEPAAG